MESFITVSRDVLSVISLDEAKKFLRVEGTDEDAVITNMIKGAVAYAENYLNQTIGSNAYVMSLDKFNNPLKVMRPPLSVLTEVAYVDSDGADAILDLATIKWDSSSGYIYLKQGESFPETGDELFAVKITYSSGGLYAAKDADDIVDACKLVLGAHYEFRDDPNERWKKASDRILRPLRNISFE